MIQTLITPQQTIALAFSDGGYLAADAISLHDIAAAEARYVTPVLGESLRDALLDGQYEALLEEYVAPAVAFSVRTMLQRALNVSTGQAGLVVADCEAASAASAAAADALQRSLVERRRSAVRRLSEHLRAHADEYPEYNVARDAVQRCSLYGDIIQIH
ncbi:MAG: hypothetical protein IIV91_03070 [Alistipes sp.]|jgi:hypothetical protein|nr:hypothetical protein [Alistipes sp.]